MAKRKKASWVGAANPADPETGVLKPRTEMNAEQSAEAAKIDPAPKLVSKPLPVQGQKVYKAPVQKRTQKKAAPLIVDAKEVRTPKNSELRRGLTSVSTAPKKKRVKKQTPVAVPKPGQAGKLGGEVVRVTPDNATQIYEERRRTTLPQAGSDVMTPAGRPEIAGAILPRTLRSAQNKKNLGGFARSHKEVASTTHEALGHLNTMATTAKGSPEHHEAQEAFNVLHAQIGQIGNKVLHKAVGLGRTVVQQFHGKPELANALKIHRGVVLGRLEEGKIAEQSRGERAQVGNPEKVENNGS